MNIERLAYFLGVDFWSFLGELFLIGSTSFFLGGVLTLGADLDWNTLVLFFPLFFANVWSFGGIKTGKSLLETGFSIGFYLGMNINGFVGSCPNLFWVAYRSCYFRILFCSASFLLSSSSFCLFDLRSLYSDSPFCLSFSSRSAIYLWVSASLLFAAIASYFCLSRLANCSSSCYLLNLSACSIWALLASSSLRSFSVWSLYSLNICSCSLLSLSSCSFYYLKRSYCCCLIHSCCYYCCLYISTCCLLSISSCSCYRLYISSCCRLIYSVYGTIFGGLYL